MHATYFRHVNAIDQAGSNDLQSTPYVALPAILKVIAALIGCQQPFGYYARNASIDWVDLIPIFFYFMKMKISACELD